MNKRPTRREQAVALMKATGSHETMLRYPDPRGTNSLRIAITEREVTIRESDPNHQNMTEVTLRGWNAEYGIQNFADAIAWLNNEPCVVCGKDSTGRIGHNALCDTCKPLACPDCEGYGLNRSTRVKCEKCNGEGVILPKAGAQ